MLSSQTRDEVNDRAMARLRTVSGNTIEGLLQLSEEQIIGAIRPVSFYTNKVSR
jgi:endonuclease III